MKENDCYSEFERISRHQCDELAIQRQEKRKKIRDIGLAKANFPRRFRQASIDKIDPRVDQPAVKKATAFTDAFKDRLDDGAGVLIIGDYGVGKTTLCCAIGNTLINEGYSVRYTTMNDLFLIVKSTFGDKSVTELDVLLSFGKSDLLILDQISAHKKSSYESGVISNLIDYRSRECLPTIAVSTLCQSKLMPVLGVETFDRLVGFGCTIIEMYGASLRA